MTVTSSVRWLPMGRSPIGSGVTTVWHCQGIGTLEPSPKRGCLDCSFLSRTRLFFRDLRVVKISQDTIILGCQCWKVRLWWFETRFDQHCWIRILGMVILVLWKYALNDYRELIDFGPVCRLLQADFLWLSWLADCQGKVAPLPLHFGQRPGSSASWSRNPVPLPVCIKLENAQRRFGSMSDS